MDHAGVTPQPPLSQRLLCRLDSLVVLRAARTMSDEEFIKLTSALGAGNTAATLQNGTETHRIQQ